MMYRPGGAIWGLLLLASAAGAQSADPLPGISTREFAVAPHTVLAGVPDMGKLLALPAAATVVVDLRTAAEGTAGEAEALAAGGFEYHHIPVDGAVIRPDQVAQLGAVAEASAGKALIVHCASANRAAMLWGAYLLERGETLERTMEIVGPALTGEDNRRALGDFAARGR